MKLEPINSLRRRFATLLRFTFFWLFSISIIVLINQNDRTLAQEAVHTARSLPLPLGLHSTDPAIAYFDRLDSSLSDRVSPELRQQKDERMKGNEEELLDPGFTVNGRQHDLSLRFVDYVEPLEALPVHNAKAIVIGTLTKSMGLVGADHTSVYTEHQFTVDQIFISDDPLLRNGVEITGTREGGTVSFPSGHLKDYVTYGEGIPKVGTRYLLFLWRDGDATDLDYGISTAYELTGGRAYALDYVMPYKQYEGVDQSVLLASMAALLDQGGQL